MTYFKPSLRGPICLILMPLTQMVALQHGFCCACGSKFVKQSDVFLMLRTKWITIKFCVTHSLNLCCAIEVCFFAKFHVDIVAFVTTLSLSNMVFQTFATYTLVFHSILWRLLILRIPIQTFNSVLPF